MKSESDRAQREAERRVATTLLDKWHLDALIGIGGMAVVFAATHRNGLRGAVKILSAPFSRDANIRARFLREGYLANRVDHPGVVRVLDDDTTGDGRAFLVMELLEGRPLHVLAEGEGGQIDAARVLFFADEVLDVLAAAHDKGIVHRDIKPDNLFLTLEGRVKVLDFGIARLDEGNARTPRGTQPGALMGTPAFMAPEQARGRWDLVGPQSDVWSLGATMFTLLTGEVVHDEETIAETLSAAFTKPARSIARVMPHLPGPIAELVDRALAQEPAVRWSGARAMQVAVRKAYQVVFGEALPKVAPQRRTLLLESPPSVTVTPVPRSHRSIETHKSSNRGSRSRQLIALGGARLLAVARGDLRGSTAAAAEARPVLASALGDDLRAAPPDSRVSTADDVAGEPSVVAAAHGGSPSAPAAPPPSRAPAHRSRPELRAMFARRH